MTALFICPCGSQKKYDECCGRYIESDINAPTAEALMRSRYVAYSRANIAYILQTMRGKAAVGFDPISAKQWAQQSTWLGLDVIQAYADNKQSDIAYVEFIAHYSLNGVQQKIHELSQFQRLDGQWFYIDGTSKQTQQSTNVISKTGRNSPCPCGSGKKYKKCCGA